MCFFFNDTATTEIYTLSLHDALPIYVRLPFPVRAVRIDPLDVEGEFHLQELRVEPVPGPVDEILLQHPGDRSEEHTSELQSHLNLVCRLLLEKKKGITILTQNKLSRL